MRDASDITWAKSARTTPKKPLPAGAWDTHAHVFGPFDKFPLVEGSKYTPPIGPAAEHRLHLDAAGFEKGCLVHAGANGVDHSGVFDAISQAPERLVCTGVVAPDTSIDTLADYATKGMRGLRFSEYLPAYGGPKPLGVLGFDSLKTFAPMLRELGWFACIWARCEHLVAQMDWIKALNIPIVIDHMASFDVKEGVEGATFQSFLAHLADSDLHVKLTPVRVTPKPCEDFEAVRPFHDAFLETAEDRMMWGSDWPYIMLDANTPDIGGQIDLFDAWTGDDALREKVFVTNPNKFFVL